MYFLLGCSASHRDVSLSKAQQLQQQGKYAEALDGYNRILRDVDILETRFRSRILVKAGECQWKLDRIHDALGSFERARAMDPQNGGALLRMAELYVSGGAPEEGESMIWELLSQSPPTAEALATLGAAYTGQGKKDEAKSAFESAMAKDPKVLSTALILAELYRGDNEVERARTVLERASIANPISPVPLLARGRMEEQDGNIELAERAYRGAVDREDSVETNMKLAQFLERTSRISEAQEVLTRVDAMSSAFSVSRGDFSFVSGSRPAALIRYKGLLNNLPVSRGVNLEVNSGTGKASRAALVARIVELEIESSRTAIAASEFGRNRAVFDEGSADILEAELALGRGDVSAGAASAERATARFPESAAAHYVLGVARLRQDDSKAAFQEWRASLERDATYVPAAISLASLALAGGDANTAERHVSAVVRNEPANMTALLLYSDVFRHQGHYAAARAMAHRALAIDNQSAAAFILLGQIAADENNIEEALIEYEKAVFFEPNSADGIDGLTQIYGRGHRKLPDLRRMEGVAAAAPGSPILTEVVGRLYARRGRYADAVRCLRRALSMDAGRKTAQDALERICNARKSPPSGEKMTDLGSFANDSFSSTR